MIYLILVAVAIVVFLIAKNLFKKEEESVLLDNQTPSPILEEDKLLQDVIEVKPEPEVIQEVLIEKKPKQKKTTSSEPKPRRNPQTRTTKKSAKNTD